MVWYLRRNVPPPLKNFVSIGVFKGHAFLIKDHFGTCRGGETQIVCPAERVEAPRTAFEQAFFPDKTVYGAATAWLEREVNRRRIDFHHSMCGHGGERWVEGHSADGFHPASRTVFQYHGFQFHGCLRCLPVRQSLCT